ncbi:Multicopper oxidase, type 1 [Dillenia turbinata]|uniref:Laccase n=1 Tax=Dillenia turbinata TaxID=194707 RepID=A0AAN8ZGF3_9MAGN
MTSIMKIFVFQVVKETPYTRLCSTKNILTVNGQFPGPTLYAHKGDTVIVDVINKGDYNLTIHWHGVKQPKNPWSDGPEYITQCPIQPGQNFTQTILLSSEEGTLWWHAHSNWTRNTIHGAIIIYPKNGTSYPFPKPYAEALIILGEWWKSQISEIEEGAISTGGDPNVSDAFTINGQPGDLYPCSKADTFKLKVKQGKTYLLRMVSNVLQDLNFLAIASHKLTVVATDASYTKPLTVDYITISPGQTIDVLLEANQPKNHYYMAARAYSSPFNVSFDNTTSTALLQYIGNYTPSSSPSLPYLPYFNDTIASVNFTGKLRSLATQLYPVFVPTNIKNKFLVTTSVNTYPCANNSCLGPNGTRLSASLNNISFVNPSIDILQAYYKNISGIYSEDFPGFPPVVFDFTAEYQYLPYELPQPGTKVRVLDYNSTVEIVLQGTSVVSGGDHPMHLHGYSFYVVGWGFGNFDPNRDPLRYNLVDPPRQNTIAVPKNGWAAIRFQADNPGVWFMHCHIDRHMTWGMGMVFIIKNGPGSEAQMLPPPPDMPPC